MLALLLLHVANLTSFASPTAQTVVLAQSGRASMPIVVAPAASEREKAAARQLAEKLQEITGARFTVRAGDGLKGIVVGSMRSFSSFKSEFKADSAPDGYLMRSTADGLLLIGTSDSGATNAVWAFLDRLGYRQFFPGKLWEYVPKQSELRIWVNSLERPSYRGRTFFVGGGLPTYHREAFEQWRERNRLSDEGVLQTGHAYEDIIRRNRAAFDANPDWLAPRAGRAGPKFRFSNPGLRQLVVKDALARFAANPSLQSISLSPSDGSGWADDPAERKLGSISDRVVGLANEVAVAVRERLGSKTIGLYAYADTSAPPAIRVDKDVVVSVATDFIHEGRSLDQVIEGWRKQGAQIGIRDYYSAVLSDLELPGQPNIANLDYAATSPAKFFGQGAQFLTASVRNDWGPSGLGYYLAARSLWSVDNAQLGEEWTEDFVKKCFGTAAVPMRRFYALLDGKNRPRLTEDLITKMKGTLAEALRATQDPDATARVYQLAQYVRYVDLHFAYDYEKGPNRQQAADRVVGHLVRMSATPMVHADQLVAEIRRRDRAIQIKEDIYTRLRNKAGTPYRSEEITAFLAAGGGQAVAFQPRADSGITFSNDLVPLSLTGNRVSTGPIRVRGRTELVANASSGRPILLTVTGGTIYQNHGPVKVQLFAGKDLVSTTEVAPNRAPNSITLRPSRPGVHRIVISDDMGGSEVEWPEGQNIAFDAGESADLKLPGRWTLAFYVPKGTRNVTGFSSGVGRLLDGDGKVVHLFHAKPTNFSILVPSGQDGKVWTFQNAQGQKLLRSVPPFLARSAQELLVPRDVAPGH